jgi:dTDP-4-amino-4,6-dideoxygalactose transaminase
MDYENLAKSNIPFIKDYKSKFNAILSKGYFVLGGEVDLFEKEFAAFCGAKYCAGVANGLDALTISLKACDFPASSDILVPSNTYIATILAVVNSGHNPVLIEPDIKTYNIDTSLIEKHITGRTKAIMPVHLYGQLCNMNEINRVKKKYGLMVIDDAAQAHGASYKGKKAGAWADITAFSFYPTKNLGCLGDGGAIVTNNKAMYNKIKAMRNYGSHKKYYNDYIGCNSRLDELQAGFLRIKLRHLDRINQHKNTLADIYFNELSDAFIKPYTQKDYYHVFHIYNIRHEARDRLKIFLESKGIKTEIHYPVPPNKQKAFEHILGGSNTPVSQQIHDTTLSLPISFFHTPKQIRQVCGVINSF